MSIPVPVRQLQAGQEIGATDFFSKDFEVTPVAKANFVTDFGQLDRMMATKSLIPGKPVPLSAIETVPAVRKGKITVAHFIADGIDIQGVLIPQQDGGIGDIVSCRNPASGVTVNAQAQSDGSLSVSAK